LVNFPFTKKSSFNGSALLRAGLICMENLVFYIIVQLNLIFGIAGLVWPDKLLPCFGLLMFPWRASHRAIRIHGVVAIAGYVMVVGKLLAFA
jgi:hypothetical protein